MTHHNFAYLYVHMECMIATVYLAAYNTNIFIVCIYYKVKNLVIYADLCYVQHTHIHNTHMPKHPVAPVLYM